MTLTINTRYLTGDRWNSNVGAVRATSLGRQRTIRWNPALGSGENHEAAAAKLAEALHEIGAAPSGRVTFHDSNDSGTRRIYTVDTP